MRIIAGDARGRRIDAPSGKWTRPTLDRVRENIFNMLQASVPGSKVLDLFAGSGSLSLEALSRGACYAVMVDSDRNAFLVQKKNLQTLKYTDRARQFNCDWRMAVKVLAGEDETFDIVFLDPPYAVKDLSDVFSSLISLLNSESLVILEHESGKEITVHPQYAKLKDRSWGYCAVSFYKLKEGE